MRVACQQSIPAFQVFQQSELVLMGLLMRIEQLLVFLLQQQGQEQRLVLVLVLVLVLQMQAPLRVRLPKHLLVRLQHLLMPQHESLHCPA
jgi:hypothetical protein